MYATHMIARILVKQRDNAQLDQEESDFLAAHAANPTLPDTMRVIPSNSAQLPIEEPLTHGAPGHTITDTPLATGGTIPSPGPVDQMDKAR